MIVNNWSDNEALEFQNSAAPDEADQQLAVRVYSSRLLGRDPDLLMHGGGNTSVKVERPDLFGQNREVLHVKGSGWDLDSIEAPGLPGVWLEPLRDLRRLDALSDEDMVNTLRCNLLNSQSPNPSVETLLHAFLPHKFVDHTHATPFLVLANLPEAEKVAKEIFGGRLGIVPYVMPGFKLAKIAAEVYEADPDVEGLLLLNHGHFAFGATAQETYDRTVDHANIVADYFGMDKPTALGDRIEGPDISMLSVLRGILAEFSGNPDQPMPIFDLRNGPDVMKFLNRADLKTLSKRGMASPDHVLKTKGWPLVVSQSDLEAGGDRLRSVVREFEEHYRTYFEKNAKMASEPKTMLPPDPRHAWIEGIGVLGMGPNAREAKIAADLAVQNIRVRAVGEDHGGFFPISEKDMFDCEYWSLEQAKLGKGTPPSFTGHVVVITGAAGAIGRATAKAFAGRGASCLLVDIDGDRLEAVAAKLPPGNRIIACDVTDEKSAEAAMGEAVLHFGGVDILVSNAGAAHGGSMLDLEQDQLRQAFELNFFAHQRFSKAAARVMRAQNRSGQILFNVSKQAVNPGKNLGAYGLPKATTMFLLRQLALELGEFGIRVNGINADRIRSGLLTDDFIAERARARGIDEESYMAGNLLKREVEARHVAEAFVSLALSERTTGHVLTVDGGNIEASLR